MDRRVYKILRRPIQISLPDHLVLLATFPLGAFSVSAPSTLDLSTCTQGWWRSTVVERRSLAGELSLSCARPAADG